MSNLWSFAIDDKQRYWMVFVDASVYLFSKDKKLLFEREANFLSHQYFHKFFFLKNPGEYLVSGHDGLYRYNEEMNVLQLFVKKNVLHRLKSLMTYIGLVQMVKVFI